MNVPCNMILVGRKCFTTLFDRVVWLPVLHTYIRICCYINNGLMSYVGPVSEQKSNNINLYLAI